MAKFHATVVLIALLSSFTVVSLARTPSDNDDSTTAATTATAVSLPNSAKTETDEPSTGVPLTKLDTFHPVNRRFDVGSNKRRPCRHHITKFYPHTRERVREVPYGNDMILSTASSVEMEEPVVHHGGRRVVRIHHHHHHHHHHDEDSDSDSDDEDRIGKRVVSRRYDGLNRGKLKELKIYREHERHHNKKGGFMYRVRKFLDRYF